MTAILRHRAVLLVLVSAIALVAAGCVGFTGTKVVTGGESTGPFVVRITCVNGSTTSSKDLTFNGEGTESTLTDFVLLESPDATCTITEIEQAGATSVTYECGNVTVSSLEAFTQGGPGMSVNGPPPPAEEVTCTETPDGLEVVIELEEPSDVSVSFTVTNDFTPVPTTAPPTTTAPAAAPETAAAAPAAAAPPVAAQPTFTG